MQGGGVNETQPLPSKVLDCDTITQVKEKLLEQVYKGTSFSHRPHTDSLDLGEDSRAHTPAQTCRVGSQVLKFTLNSSLTHLRMYFCVYIVDVQWM